MEGRRRGPWLFLSLAPVCSAQAFIPAHTHRHTEGPTSKRRHARVHNQQHTHASHTHRQQGDIVHKLSCTCTHTHTLQNTATLAVMEPEENGKISYYFLCSNLERMCFFFFLFFFAAINILIFFPL